jgi:hypothetical protein
MSQNKAKKPRLQISSREAFGGGLGFEHAQRRVHPQEQEDIPDQPSHNLAVVTVMELPREPVGDRPRGVLSREAVEDLCFVFRLELAIDVGALQPVDRIVLLFRPSSSRGHRERLLVAYLSSLRMHLSPLFLFAQSTAPGVARACPATFFLFGNLGEE